MFFTGGYLKINDPTAATASISNNGFTPDTMELYQYCNVEAIEKRLAWNTTAEYLCGRPLGLRFRKVLYIIYYIVSYICYVINIYMITM